MKEVLLLRGPELRRRILIVMIVAVPLFFMRNLSDPINIPKLALFAFGVTAVLALRAAELAQGVEWPNLRSLLVPAAALSIPLTWGWIFSPYRLWSWMGYYPRYLGLLPYLLSISFGLLIADAFRGRPREVLIAFASAGAGVGFYAALQWIGLDPFEWSARGVVSDEIVSTLGNSNFVGGFLGIALPVCLSLWFIQMDRRWVISVTAFVLLGWAAATSQTGWAAGIAGASVTGGILLSQRVGIARMVGVGIATLTAATVVGVVLLGVFAEGKAPATVQRRAEWWVAASEMAREAPLLGKGPDAFALDQGLFRTTDDVRQSTTAIETHPHSLFLWLATSSGLVGAAGFLILVGWVGFRTWQTPSGDPVLAGFAGGMTAYLVQSLASIDTLSLRIAFWTCAGGLLAASGEPERLRKVLSKAEQRRRRIAPLQGIPVLAGGLALVLLAGWFSVRLVAADAAFQDARDSIDEGSFEATEQLFRRTLSRRGEPAYRSAFAAYLGSLAAPVAEQDFQRAQGLVQGAQNQFAYLGEVPDPRALTSRARLAAGWHQAGLVSAGAALEYYGEAIERDPHDFYLSLEAAGLAMTYESYSAAAGFYETALETTPEDAAVWVGLARAHANAGATEAARTALDRAVELGAAPSSVAEVEAVLEEAAGGK